MSDMNLADPTEESLSLQLLANTSKLKSKPSAINTLFASAGELRVESRRKGVMLQMPTEARKMSIVEKKRGLPSRSPSPSTSLTPVIEDSPRSTISQDKARGAQVTPTKEFSPRSPSLSPLHQRPNQNSVSPSLSQPREGEGRTSIGKQRSLSPPDPITQRHTTSSSTHKKTQRQDNRGRSTSPFLRSPMLFTPRIEEESQFDYKPSTSPRLESIIEKQPKSRAPHTSPSAISPHRPSFPITHTGTPANKATAQTSAPHHSTVSSPSSGHIGHRKAFTSPLLAKKPDSPAPSSSRPSILSSSIQGPEGGGADSRRLSANPRQSLIRFQSMS